MTEKLYYTDGSMREFTAAVVSCTEEDGRIAVELDRTAFFPEGGGQAPDPGAEAMPRLRASVRKTAGYCIM